jgi:YegS/Rv2252/BmrU family lipid kinase
LWRRRLGAQAGRAAFSRCFRATEYNPAVRRAFLLYNPESGTRREARAQQIARIAQILRSAGVELETCATTHAGSATQQAQAAAAAGFDSIVVCGGDGTVNEAMNGLVGSGSQAALGVVPLGSGNLLATDLRLPSNPEAAAKALLGYTPREIHPGFLTFQKEAGQQRRNFIVAAGVGADAELMYRTAVESKQRFGRMAYFIEMARMTRYGKFPMFDVEWQDQGGALHRDQVSLVMAIRAHQFPGLLRFVKLESAITRDDFRLLLFRTNKVRHFLNYFASVASGRNWNVPQVGVVFSHRFRCTSSGPNDIHCEADGEALGRLPVEAGIDERTFQLLMPPE